ncbi:unnamed protein product [Microthlaspi erraticum]|uniref:Uncharacterized protein n=1 Tax=Microthlaspi erraticum TaxID=1685480 RepID=A0A6D2IA97_9BRAS|nr:unnamed protein product [Microthlaspi erraticum]
MVHRISGCLTSPVKSPSQKRNGRYRSFSLLLRMTTLMMKLLRPLIHYGEILQLTKWKPFAHSNRSRTKVVHPDSNVDRPWTRNPQLTVHTKQIEIGFSTPDVQIYEVSSPEDSTPKAISPEASHQPLSENHTPRRVPANVIRDNQWAGRLEQYLPRDRNANTLDQNKHPFFTSYIVTSYPTFKERALNMECDWSPVVERCVTGRGGRAGRPL